MRRPFSSGTEHLDWQHRNCQRCAKFVDNALTQAEINSGTDWPCPIDYAVTYGAMSDGTISDEIATRVGFEKGDIWFPECPEKEELLG